MQKQESIESLITRTSKTTRSYAFISLNIKNFKGINLRFGYAFGDSILQQLTNILIQQLQVDEGYCHVYGDVFELWLHDEDNNPLTTRLYHIDDLFYHIADERINKSLFLSFGIYIPQPYDSYAHMRACADFCRSQSSDSLKLNTHMELYHESLQRDYIRKQELASTLRKGFLSDAFHIVLQPKISLHDKQIVGGEALLRWHHPNHHVSTQELILLSEQNGFVRELDIYIFKEVCKLLHAWYTKYHRYLKISVNVSRYHFENPLFFQEYLTIFQAYQLPPSIIEFEITESAINNHLDSLQSVIEQMHHHGFSIALDDFGTGASSLVSLKNLPISTLKLDRSFFLEESTKSRIIVKAMLHMTKQLGITSVCEGIENIEQEAFLITCEADIIQGYLYYPPLSIQQFEDIYFT